MAKLLEVSGSGYYRYLSHKEKLSPRQVLAKKIILHPREVKGHLRLPARNRRAGGAWGRSTGEKQFRARLRGVYLAPV